MVEKSGVQSSPRIQLETLEKSKYKFFKKQNVVKEVYDTLISKSDSYKDSAFMPTLNSLLGINLEKSDSDIEDELERFEDIEWSHADQIMHISKGIISANQFSPGDIVQGKLGDCYFLSALSSIAVYPKIVAELFYFVDIEKLQEQILLGQEINFNNEEEISSYIIELKVGDSHDLCEEIILLNNFYKKYFDKLQMYFVKLRIHGEWTYLSLDPFFPTLQSQLIFATSASNDLWVPIIEKAWAKVLGGYYKTPLGSPAEGLLSLSNFPCTVCTHKNFEKSSELWRALPPPVNKSEFVLSSIIQLKGKKSTMYSNLGLITNHCYGVLGYYEVINSRKTYRLILLRNPHGTQNYSGMFGDSDSIWASKELKEKVGFNIKDNGSFFMCFEDYFKLFDHTFVSEQYFNYSNSYYKIKKAKLKLNSLETLNSCFLLTISSHNSRPNQKIDTRPESCVLTLFKKYKRVYGKGIKLGMASMIAVKITNTGLSITKEGILFTSTDLESLKLVDSAENNRSVNLRLSEAFATGGHYLIFCSVYNGVNFPIGFTFNFNLPSKYSKDFKLQMLNTVRLLDFPILFDKIFYSIIKSQQLEEYPKAFCTLPSHKLMTLSLNCGHGVFFIQNNNTDGEIKTKIIFKEFSNLFFLDDSIDTSMGEIEISTKPKSYSLLVFVKSKMRCGFNFSAREHFVLGLDFAKKNVKTKGKFHEVLISKKKSGVLIYYMKYGDGYLLMPDNQSSKSCKITLIITKLENLVPEIKLTNNTVDVVLKPKESKFLNFKQTNISEGGNANIVYNFGAIFI